MPRVAAGCLLSARPTAPRHTTVLATTVAPSLSSSLDRSGVGVCVNRGVGAARMESERGGCRRGHTVAVGLRKRAVVVVRRVGVVGWCHSGGHADVAVPTTFPCGCRVAVVLCLAVLCLFPCVSLLSHSSTPRGAQRGVEHAGARTRGVRRRCPATHEALS